MTNCDDRSGSDDSDRTMLRWLMTYVTQWWQWQDIIHCNNEPTGYWIPTPVHVHTITLAHKPFWIIIHPQGYITSDLEFHKSGEKADFLRTNDWINNEWKCRFTKTIWGGKILKEQKLSILQNTMFNYDIYNLQSFIFHNHIRF